MEVSDLVSMLVDNLLAGLTTNLYRGYNPFTQHHGHPSRSSSINITIEKQPFEDALPIKNGDFPANGIVYWRVIHTLNLHHIILGHLSSVRSRS